MAFFRITMLFAFLTVIFLAVGYVAAGTFGMVFGLSIAIAMNFFSYWYSEGIVHRMYRLKKADSKKYSELHETVERLAKKAGIPKPRVYIMETDLPNAFATGRSPKKGAVAVTTGLLSRLTSKETEGVLAHELGHIKNRDTLISTVAATISGALTWFAYMFLFGSDEGNALSYLLIFILAPVAAMFIRMAISRSREYSADAFGGKIANPLDLASALEKISSFSRGVKVKGNDATAHMFIINPFSAGSLAGLFSTHPSTEERIRRLKAMA